MNWRDCAEQDLRKYAGQKESLKNIIERIVILKMRFGVVNGASTDRTPVQGGCSHMEDAMLDNLVERERLTLTYRANKRLIDMIERGLARLTDTERQVLDAFYIHRPKGHIDFLMARLGYEQAQIYRIKDDALYHFTVTMYGIMEY